MISSDLKYMFQVKKGHFHHYGWYNGLKKTVFISIPNENIKYIYIFFKYCIVILVAVFLDGTPPQAFRRVNPESQSKPNQTRPKQAQAVGLKNRLNFEPILQFKTPLCCNIS